MRIIYTFLISLFCIIFLPANSWGYSLSGAEISYRHIGSDSFEVTALYFVDCSQTHFQFNISVTAAPVNCNSATKYAQLTLTNTTDVSPLCPSACNRCNSSCSHGVGYKLETFKGIIDLGSICDTWRLNIDRCCRNSTVSTGTGFYQGISAYIDKSMNPVNRPPVFDRVEPFSFCASTCNTVNMGGVDPDGDSLVYSFVPPSAGAFAGNFSYTGSYTYERPFAFNGFPSTSLPYNYSACRGLHLDRQTGLLQFKGMQNQTSVLAIKVEEYRNGVLVGYTIRDRVITFRQCDANNQPRLTGLDSTGDFRLLACKGDTIDLPVFTRDNDASDSTKIWMERSPPGAVFTTFSSGRRMHGNLYWVVPDTNTQPVDYHFIITVSDNNCPFPARMTRDFIIHVVPELEKKHTVSVGSCGLATFNYPSDYIQEFIWAGTPSFADTGQTVQYLYEARGEFPFSLKVSTLSGCSRVFNDTVDIGSNVSFVEIDLVTDTMICEGESLDLIVSASNGQSPYSYKWSDGLGNNDTLHLTPSTSVKYYVEAEDKSGCKNNDSVLITVNPLPVAFAGVDFELCANEGSQALSGIPAGGSWSGTGLSGNTFDPAISGAGDFKLKYEFTDFNQCSSEDSLQVRVHPVPTTSAGNDIDVCIEEAPVTLTPVPAGGIWTGAGVTSGVFDPIAAGAGTYYLRYTYVDSNNCETQDSLRANVRENPATVDAGASQEICGSNELVNLFGMPAGGIWTGTGITQQSGSYLFDPVASGAGAHILTYKYILNGCAKQDSTSVTVHANPEAQFTATPETGKAPLQVQFNNSTDVPTDEWYWVFGNNLATSTFRNPNFTFSDTGLYSVYLYVKNTSTGCEDSILKTDHIRVGSPVGILEQVFAGQEVKVYPVPATEQVVLVADASGQQLQLTIYDSHGKLVKAMQVLSGNRIVVEREQLKPGLYLFRLAGPHGYLQTGKIIFR
ncbi:MAG: PKD domain-containing protein [Bacteroidia bacterium]